MNTGVQVSICTPARGGGGGTGGVSHWLPLGVGLHPARATPVWRKAGLSFSHKVGVTVSAPLGWLRGLSEFIVGGKCLGETPADSKHYINAFLSSSQQHLGLQGSNRWCDLK